MNLVENFLKFHDSENPQIKPKISVLLELCHKRRHLKFSYFSVVTVSDRCPYSETKTKIHFRIEKLFMF